MNYFRLKVPVFENLLTIDYQIYMERKKIIGIMGPGEGASKSDLEIAFKLGKLLAESGFYVLTGGRASGVMEAAMKGTKSAGGTTIGILPSADGADTSNYVDIPINTGMGSARNNINVLTAEVLIAVGIGPGTASEISLAIKAKKPVILLNWSEGTKAFFSAFDDAQIHFCTKVDEVLSHVEQL